jgi:hypothetical protein
LRLSRYSAGHQHCCDSKELQVNWHWKRPPFYLPQYFFPNHFFAINSSARLKGTRLLKMLCQHQEPKPHLLALLTHFLLADDCKEMFLISYSFDKLHYVPVSILKSIFLLFLLYVTKL